MATSTLKETIEIQLALSVEEAKSLRFFTSAGFGNELDKDKRIRQDINKTLDLLLKSPTMIQYFRDQERE